MIYSSLSLQRFLVDDRLGDVLRRLDVMLEFHRVGRAPLRGRAQAGRVAEHLRQRHLGLDHDRARHVFLALHLPRRDDRSPITLPT
jgi:hypothetical protein